MISDFENDVQNESSTKIKKHHEDTPAFKQRFNDDVQKLSSRFVYNPFELIELCALNNSSIHFNAKVFSDISFMSKVGQEQFETFWNGRLVRGKVAIDVPIKKNCFNTMANEQHDIQGKELVLSQSAVTKLRSAAVYREEKVTNLFSTEILGVAQSISENRNTLYHGTKSDILKRFS